jgi:hypothetical protein
MNKIKIRGRGKENKVIKHHDLSLEDFVLPLWNKVYLITKACKNKY